MPSINFHQKTVDIIFEKSNQINQSQKFKNLTVFDCKLIN